jgi:hypothetical protein
VARSAAGLLALLAGAAAALAQQPEAAYPDAQASDPVRLGLMVGSPPPPDKRVAYEDGSYMRFPQLRWALSHWRELRPTAPISRGRGKVSQLPRAERGDIDDISFTPLGGGPRMTWRESLAANYTDGIVVLHRGKIIYERYFGALTADGQHIAHSVTKSFFGTLAEMLIAEGKLKEDALISAYLPELRDSAFGDATVRQLLDMTTALKFSEKYTDPTAEIWDFARSAGMLPVPAGYQGPRSMYDYLPTVRKSGDHGAGFAYRSANAEVTTWLIRRVTGQSAQQVLQQRIWEKLGAEQDAYIQVDAYGNAIGAGGLNLGLRDLARFGEMMRLNGRWNGLQIVPEAVVEAIRRGGSQEKFVSGGYTTLPGWSYRSQWWISHDDHGAYEARGVYGQAIYVDPKAQMVIARFGSAPWASNIYLNPKSLPAFRALAEHLIATERQP